MRFSELLKNLSFYVKDIRNEPKDELLITGIQNNHLNIKKGHVFICIKGYMVDGHRFAKEAEKKGAAAIIAERPVGVSIPTIILKNTRRAQAEIATLFYSHPSKHLKMVGITGTNGKTTIAYLLREIFSLNNDRTGMIGTIETIIGNKKYPTNLTTPDAISLQQILSKMHKEKVKTVFMEVSSHALSLGRVHGCDFDVAVYSNLSQDHLDFHQTMDHYLHAKSLLFSQLGNSFERKKYAIINKDDSFYKFFIDSTAQHIVTYSCTRKADFMAKNIKMTAKKTAFTLVTPKGEVPIKTSLIGDFNISNMLAAASVAFVLGVPLKIVQKAFQQVEGIPGRFEVVNEKEPYTVIVDYAHTPDSLSKVLQTIRCFAKGKVYVVVGCGGNRDRSKRPLMAKVAVKKADYAIFTSDNPRRENPRAILADMIQDLEEKNYQIVDDRKKAIHLAIQLARKNDIILIAGKGHETYQEINGVTYEFDDRKVALEAIEKKES